MNTRQCDRCKQPTFSTKCSMFNTQDVCPDCIAREKAHPLYEKARADEEASVRRGDLNFPGIGLPAELETPQ